MLKLMGIIARRKCPRDAAELKFVSYDFAGPLAEDDVKDSGIDFTRPNKLQCRLAATNGANHLKSTGLKRLLELHSDKRLIF
jgi:hypothetical protein